MNYTHYVSLVYTGLYKFTLAIRYAQKSIEILESHKKKSVILAQSYGNLSAIYTRIYQFPEAISVLNNALKIQQKLLPKDHPDFASTYSNFADTYFFIARNSNTHLEKIKHYDLVISYQTEAIRILERALRKSFSINHAHNLSVCFTSLANTYDDLFGNTQNTECLDLLFFYDEKSLDILLKYIGEAHPLTAAAYNNNGLNYLKYGNLSKAKELIEKALTIKKSILPKEHPTIGLGLYNMGRVYTAMGKKKEAKQHLLEAITLLEDSHQDENDVLGDARKLYNQVK